MSNNIKKQNMIDIFNKYIEIDDKLIIKNKEINELKKKIS